MLLPCLTSQSSSFEILRCYQTEVVTTEQMHHCTFSCVTIIYNVDRKVVLLYFEVSVFYLFGHHSSASARLQTLLHFSARSFWGQPQGTRCYRENSKPVKDGLANGNMVLPGSRLVVLQTSAFKGFQRYNVENWWYPKTTQNLRTRNLQVVYVQCTSFIDDVSTYTKKMEKEWYFSYLDPTPWRYQSRG